MPKETIKTIPGSLIVGWEKGKHAQIGVDLGNKFKFLKSDEDEIYTGLWVTLCDTDREEFNRLIRLLRRVRNDVCGKDA